MTEPSSYEQKKRTVRIARAKAAINRAEAYLKTHSNAQAATVLIRDLRDMLNEITSELEFPTATGETTNG